MTIKSDGCGRQGIPRIPAMGRKDLMMREIKFRGKTIAGDWIVGDLVHHDWSFNRVIPLGIRPAGCSALAVIPETVGLYTGLKDKFGNEIYEGDILTNQTFSDWVVKYSTDGYDYGSGCDICGWLLWSEKYGEDVSLLSLATDDNVQVIGNIYE